MAKPEGVPIYRAPSSGVPEPTGETLAFGDVVGYSWKQEVESSAIDEHGNVVEVADDDEGGGETHFIDFYELVDGRGWLMRTDDPEDETALVTLEQVNLTLPYGTGSGKMSE